MIRVAAVGDVHYDESSSHRLKNQFETLNGRADLFLIAGDLTRSGEVGEVLTLIEDLKNIKLPIISVLGNHDFHSDKQKEIQQALRDAGVIVLEGESVVLKVHDMTVGVFGLKGFGGGFGNACCTDFGEPETKAFARHAKRQAEILSQGLSDLQADFRFALLHYSPIEGTLLGERREIYPFLGSFLLGEAIDEADVDGVFHGHAHFGIERGNTPAGVPVRNVAQMVIRHAFNIYSFEKPKLKHERS